MLNIQKIYFHCIFNAFGLFLNISPKESNRLFSVGRVCSKEDVIRFGEVSALYYAYKNPEVSKCHIRLYLYGHTMQL